MKQLVQSSRGCSITFTVPSSTEELDQLSGTGTSYAAAMQQIVYRNLLPKVWREFFTKAAEAFGIARPTITETDSEGKEVESGVDDSKYYKLIEKSVSVADRNALVQSIVNSWTGWDISSETRSKKPLPMFLAKAKEYLARFGAAPDLDAAVETFTVNSASRGASYPLERDENGYPTQESIAWRLQEIAQADVL